MNPYKDEIIHAHAAIESWLSKGIGSLEALIARFAADFTMITPGGVCLDYPALGAFFQAQRGCRPGQAETVRWSTVILKRERGRIVWRHLHETTVTA
ncbi:DUF4440 domain-containing protein [Salmonella enterica subsp. enterica serovar Montevideo]